MISQATSFVKKRTILLKLGKVHLNKWAAEAFMRCDECCLLMEIIVDRVASTEPNDAGER